ncbi:MAG: hypothetical protein J6V25_02605 [Oscillospiraceae bacterium]|nr:hypothetical protein [Oscillospiraceae bacterium]
MEWIKDKQQAVHLLKKYGCMLLVLIAGLILMATSETENQIQESSEPAIAAEETLEDSLENILSLIQGAGKVQVLLTQKEGKLTLYQTDEDSSYGSQTQELRTQTVMVRDSQKEETGLIRQTIAPIYRGAVVVCQGADDPKVKLAMVEAVMDATGLPSNCITVLKMK